MKQKSLLKEYRKHGLICLAIVAVAFGVNWEIDVVQEVAQSHQYEVSGPVNTLWKEITEVKVEGNQYVFCGWGFDSNYYDETSQCELILKDTETGESLWPQMEQGAEAVEIANCYTNGNNYDDAGFQGSIKLSKLAEGSVYEILLRYTSSYMDEKGNEKEYVRIVTMDKFFYQRKMTEYNSKVFKKPEIEGTELEKILKNARVFCYFPEEMWVYYDKENLYYIIEKQFFIGKENYEIPVQWSTGDINQLPEERRESGFGNEGFIASTKIVPSLETKKYIVLMTDIPANYGMYFETGIYEKGKGWVLHNEPKQFEFLNEN